MLDNIESKDGIERPLAQVFGPLGTVEVDLEKLPRLFAAKLGWRDDIYSGAGQGSRAGCKIEEIARPTPEIKKLGPSVSGKAQSIEPFFVDDVG